MIKLKNLLNEDLRKWFGKGPEGSTTGGGWDRYNSKGEKVGKCGDSKEGDSYAACLSKEKAAKLGKDGIAAFVKRKRAAQKDAGDAKKGGEQSKGQKPTFVKTGVSEQNNNEKEMIDGIVEMLKQVEDKKNRKEMAMDRLRDFRKEGIKVDEKQFLNRCGIKSLEEKLNLFLEKNCPTDPGKWSASKSAAKRKFDVYPSAYANGWAAKNYKSKGGGWKTCK